MRKGIKNGLSVITILVVSLGLAVFSFVKVYEKMTSPQLAIALVNEDKGAIYNDVPVYFGNAFVKEIERDEVYEWSVVSRGTAENGLAKANYDLAIIIPSNFSDAAIALDDVTPEPVAVIFKVAPSANFLTDEHAKNAVGDVQATLNNKLIDMYFVSVLHNLQLAQSNVSAMVEHETEHGEILRNHLASDLSDIHKDTTNVKGQSESLSSGVNNHKTASEVLQTFSEDAFEQQEDFQTQLRNHAVVHKDYTNFMDIILDKDTDFKKALETDTSLQKMMTRNQEILKNLELDLDFTKELQQQIDDLQITLKPIIENIDQDEDTASVIKPDDFWQEIRAMVDDDIPRDGSLNNILPQIEAHCSATRGYDTENQDLLAIRKICQTLEYTDEEPLLKKYSADIKTLNISLTTALEELASEQSSYTITLKMPAVVGTLSDSQLIIDEQIIELVTTQTDEEVVYTGIYTVLDELETENIIHAFTSTLETTEGSIEPTLEIMISDGNEDVKVDDFTAPFRRDPSYQQIKNAYMLDAYFTVYYGKTALELIDIPEDQSLLESLIQAQEDFANNEVRTATVTAITDRVYVLFALRLQEVQTSLTEYQTMLTQHQDAIRNRIQEVQELATGMKAFQLVLEDWRTQEQTINQDLKLHLADLNAGHETLIELERDEAHLFQMSEGLVESTTHQALSATHLNVSAERLAKASVDVQTKTDKAVGALGEIISVYDENVDDNLNYSENFNTVFNNSRIGERDNNDLYGFLAQPVSRENLSRNINGAQTLLPYFTVMLLGIVGFFIAAAFSSRTRKYSMNDADAPSITRQNISRALFMALFACATGIIIGTISSKAAQLTGTDLMTWLVLTVLASLVIVWGSYALLKWLRMVGMLLLMVILFVYLMLNGVIGYSMELGSGLALLQSYSPLWLLEQVFLEILFALPNNLWLTIGILGLVAILSLLAIMFVDWRKRGVHVHA